MIYLDLFLGFLYVGCFSFGGAYAAIPLIRDVVLQYGWINDETLSYMIAISESTIHAQQQYDLSPFAAVCV